MRSAGIRFFIVGVLTLLMFIPLFFASDIVSSRADYARQTNASVGQEWGGAQVLRGPQMVIPVTKTVTQKRKQEIIDPDTGEPRRSPVSDEVLYRVIDERVTTRRDPIYLMPKQFEVDLNLTTQIRKRGIFTVPVYQADSTFVFGYDLQAAANQLGTGETLQWDRAQLRFALSSNRALRGAAELRADDATLRLEPDSWDHVSGITSALGDPRGVQQYQLTLGLNGAHSLNIAPVGRNSRITMTSDWPDPKFVGAFLPDGSDVSDAGFSATWTIPHLARTQPEQSRTDQLGQVAHSAFGVDLLRPNDFYQKAYRVANYGILFIALTFLTVLLVTPRDGTPTHPVQYILIGLLQSLFVVLMVAYAEHIGFGPAYLLSAVAVTLSLMFYGFVGLKLGRRALVLGAVLAVLYALLYLILRSADFALLAGSTLIFAALVGTMYATRNEQWYGDPTAPKSGGFFRKKPPEPNVPPTEG